MIIIQGSAGDYVGKEIRVEGGNAVITKVNLPGGLAEAEMHGLTQRVADARNADERPAPILHPDVIDKSVRR